MNTSVVSIQQTLMHKQSSKERGHVVIDSVGISFGEGESKNIAVKDRWSVTCAIFYVHTYRLFIQCVHTVWVG